MSSSISSVKTRIKSINSTKKITGAMKSVATVKLNRMSRITTNNNLYNDKLIETLNFAYNSNFEFSSPYIKNNDKTNCFYIIFASDVGLCGSYNVSLLKGIETSLNADDYIYVVGNSIYDYLKTKNYNVLNDKLDSDNLSFSDVTTIFNLACKMFLDNKVGYIKIIFNTFVNSITYHTSVKTLLPFVSDKKGKTHEVLLEPNPNMIFDSLLELTLKSQIYNYYLNAKTSEQVARRFAMENATRNADDLIDDLTLEYNKARQGKITQEITEIVSGANAI